MPTTGGSDGYTYVGCYALDWDYGDDFDWDNRTYSDDMAPSVSNLRCAC